MINLLLAKIDYDPTQPQFQTNLPTVTAGHDQIQQVLAIVFAVAAAIAVLMIVIAGLRFVTAQGNPQDIAKARNTIVYALIGLLIAIAGEAIVSLAVKNL